MPFQTIGIFYSIVKQVSTLLTQSLLVACTSNLSDVLSLKDE